LGTSGKSGAKIESGEDENNFILDKTDRNRSGALTGLQEDVANNLGGKVEYTENTDTSYIVADASIANLEKAYAL
jgi:hypothetical protein